MFNSICLLSFAATIFHSAAIDHELPTNGSAEIILNDMNSVISAKHFMNRASPQCWIESITTLSRSISGGASYCASMTTEQQKVLALELTNCQLMEENRSLFAQDDDNMLVSPYASCHVGKGGSEPYEVSSCLPFMTDFALNLYHQMYLYANDVCNRLTYDMLEQQKEETTRMLIKASSSFVDLTKQQQAETDTAQKSLMEAISRNQLYLQEQQQKWEEETHAREREVQAREKAARLAMQEMVNKSTIHFQEQQQKWEELNSARDKEMHVIEERREQAEAIIEKQRHDIERMQEVIVNTNSQMEPLSRMHLYVKMAKSVLQSVLFFFLSMNVSWMITIIPLLKGARRSLYFTFFFGFVAEVAVVCLTEDTTLVDDRVKEAELIRIYAIAVAFIACVISFLMSCIYSKRDTSVDISLDELLKRQAELATMLGAAQQMNPNVSTPMIMQSLHTAQNTVDQPRHSYDRQEEPADSFIISNPNFKPSKRLRNSTHYHHQKSVQVCGSPVPVPKEYAAAAPITEVVNTVTPNSRIRAQYDCKDDHATVSGQDEMKHIQQMQSNAKSPNDSSDEDQSMDESSDEDDGPAQLVMVKKKRKHAELQLTDSELGDSPSKHQSKEDETKKKKAKLGNVKIY